MTLVSLQLPLLVPCRHWSPHDGSGVVGRCAIGAMRGYPVVGFCVHGCRQAEWTDGGAWQREYQAETSPQSRVPVAATAPAAPAAAPAATGSCRDCAGVLIHIWFWMEWIGRPLPLRRLGLRWPIWWEEFTHGACVHKRVTLRLRWQSPVYVKPEPGCGCIKKFKDWFDRRRAAREAKKETTHGAGL